MIKALSGKRIRPDTPVLFYAYRYFAGIIITCLYCTVAADEGDSVIGIWYTEKCQALFDFYRSGEEYQAKMIPLKKPDMIDSKNPVDSLKTRKLHGIIAVYGLVYDSKKKRWVNGKVYNPQDGRTYSCYCSLTDGGKRLFFKGFIGVSVLGGSQTWTREKCIGNRKKIRKK